MRRDRFDTKLFYRPVRIKVHLSCLRGLRVYVVLSSQRHLPTELSRIVSK